MIIFLHLTTLSSGRKVQDEIGRLNIGVAMLWPHEFRTKRYCTGVMALRVGLILSFDRSVASHTVPHRHHHRVKAWLFYAKNEARNTVHWVFEYAGILHVLLGTSCYLAHRRT